MLKNKKSLLAILLSLVLILNYVPIMATSYDAEQLNSVDAGVVGSDDTSNEAMTWIKQEYISDEIIGRVKEVEEWREENVKHFRLDNGSYEAVVYGGPVHRMDENGVWRDIDNNLYLRTVKNSSFYSTDDMRIRFADSFKYGVELFSIMENKCTISMTPISLGHISTEIMTPAVTSPIIVNAQARSEIDVYETIEEAIKIDNQSSILYTNIRENTDIEYVLDGNSVKENIIVKGISNNYNYSFRINLIGMEAFLDASGGIVICDATTKEARYVIPAPFMYDANGEKSYDVYYELTTIRSGEYMLSVVADDEWINSDSRAFPIVIDPTIQKNVSNDTFIDSENPTANYYSSPVLYASKTKTALVKPPIPNFYGNISTIHSAKLYMSYYGVEDNFIVSAHKVTGMIDSTTTYNTAPSISTENIWACIVYSDYKITDYYPGTIFFDITEEFSDWYFGAAIAYGIAISYYSGPEKTVAFHSSEVSSHAPYLRVEYSQLIPDGVYAIKNGYGSSYWMTVENDSVDAGDNIQHINLANSPAQDFDNSSLFKISGIEGMYVIRLMTNNNLTLSVSGNEVITKEIPSRDEDVPAEDRFYITRNSTGYIISPYKSPNIIAMDTVSNPNLAVVSRETTGVMTKWSLEQYTGEHRSDTIIYFPGSWDSIGIVDGTTGEASLIGWSTYINANTLSMEIKEGYEDLGTVAWNAEENKVTISATNPGRIQIYSDVLYGDETLVSRGYFEFIIVPAEGIYYIYNVDTGKYIDIDGPSTAEGAIIHQWHFHTGDQARWIVEHVEGEGGYVRLKSVYSNLYIGVDASNMSIVKQYAANDYTLWMIDRTASDNLVLSNKATEGSGKVLALPLNENENGTDLAQISYTDNDNCRDEWKIIKKVISYVNYYDKTFVDQIELQQNIEVANSFANIVYLNHYGVGMYMDGAASLYNTVADSCNTGVHMPCDDVMCGSNCGEDHHKNIFRISNQIYQEPRENDHIYVLWTNHNTGTYCYEINGIHTTSNAIASVPGYRPVIHFLTMIGTDAVQQACMAIGLVHETAHTLQMRDVYDDIGHDIEVGTICVMEKCDRRTIVDFYRNVLQGFAKPFCNSCDEAMKEYTSNITILGN